MSSNMKTWFPNLNFKSGNKSLSLAYQIKNQFINLREWVKPGKEIA